MSQFSTASTVDALRRAVEDVFQVESITEAKRPQGAVLFRGRLTADSDQAFAAIRPRFEQIGFTPQIEPWEHGQAITAMPGTVVVKPSNPMVNLVLFLLTVASAFYSGLFDQNGINITSGLVFTVSLMLILGAHELGHYFVARYYGVPVTLPYFIPMPFLSPWGTMGAVIVQKTPYVNRKTLFDVGIAGPLAGLVFAVPLLFAGLAMSPLGQCTGTCFQEGNSIFYGFAKFVIFGQWLPTARGLDVQLSPMAWAAWVGLLITSLNLLPAGQLDGGHAIFALFGRRAKYFGYAAIALLVLLSLPALPHAIADSLGMASLVPDRIDLSFLGVPGLYFPGWEGWIVWVGMLGFFGVEHPVPLNDVSELGMGRKLLALFAIVLFVLLFMPLPLMVTMPS